jgi:hypothetical protein
MSPSLALLNFEQSPSDRPMFDLTTHQRSVSGDSLEVHHSSPMTVPGSARQATQYSIFPLNTDLPAGTIPDTPGPMQRAFTRDPANHIPWGNASPTSFERCVPSTPVLTPLPGTNRSVGDLDPELVPLPPSVNPCTMRLGRTTPGYFDITVDETPQMDDTDVLNGLACLRLADEHSGAFGGRSIFSDDPGTDAPIGRRGTAEEMRHQHEDAKLQDTVNTLEIPRDRTRGYRRQQQDGELQENVRILSVSKHCQVLPFRIKQQDGDLQDPVRKDSCTSEDWETCSGKRSTAMTSEHSLHNRSLDQPRTSSPLSIYSAASHPEEGNGVDHGNDAPPEFAYVIWDRQNRSYHGPISETTWGRHTGLYDGSGYGCDSGPSTPREPDEGTQDMHSKGSSTPLSVGGDSNRSLREEDRQHETARELPLTAHGQRNCESLESIYRAYAYPPGDGIPSSSNSSGGGDGQRAATKGYEISS